VQEGSKDTLSSNLVNFRKCQKMSEVICDILRWQSKPHNFTPFPDVLASLEEVLSFSDRTDLSSYLWNLSLKHEPREQEGDKMRRLLEESGFL
jgi:son of sevenless